MHVCQVLVEGISAVDAVCPRVTCTPPSISPYDIPLITFPHTYFAALVLTSPNTSGDRAKA